MSRWPVCAQVVYWPLPILGQSGQTRVLIVDPSPTAENDTTRCLCHPGCTLDAFTGKRPLCRNHDHR